MTASVNVASNFQKLDNISKTQDLTTAIIESRMYLMTLTLLVVIFNYSHIKCPFLKFSFQS